MFKSRVSETALWIRTAAESFGATLNRHAPEIVKLIHAKHVIAKVKANQALAAMLDNCGPKFKQFLEDYYPHLIPKSTK
jgi:hypothetical protein